MKRIMMIWFVCFCIVIRSVGQLTDNEIHDLKTRRVLDTSFIYCLPFEKGERHLFIQGANSSFSHKNELSFDFKMAKGSKICAARSGVIIATKFDSNVGGLNDEFLDDGNHIVIRHSDGSIAQYWHLDYNGVLVNIGDTVSMGQIIGISGNTGYSAFPHLHFQVLSPDGREILPRFKTTKGNRFIRPGRYYKSVR